MLNRIVLIGRLVREVELRYTPNGVAVATFTLAVDRQKYKDREKETDFINCQAWSKLAENCANYLAKGKLAAVDGSLRIETWDKDGERKYKTVVNAENVRFLSPKDAGSDSFIAGEVEHSDDDLPF